MKLSQSWVPVLLAVSGLQALVIAGLIATGPKSNGTATAPAAADKAKPVKVELNKETGQKRVTLTAKAAERLGIATAEVRDEAAARKTVALGRVYALAGAPITVTAPVAGIVTMPAQGSTPAPGTHLAAKQTVLRMAEIAGGKKPVTTTAGITPAQQPQEVAIRPGEIAPETAFVSVEAPCDCTMIRMLVQPGQAVAAGQPLFEAGDANAGILIRVPRTGDMGKVANEQPARLLPLGSNNALAGAIAKPVSAPAIVDAKDDDAADTDDKKADDALWYQVQTSGQGVMTKQPVRLELPLTDDGAPRKAIPYSAVFYDASGQTWAYLNPEPLVYTRQRITVDYVEGDMAVLTSGPAAGTRVVSVGAVLLYGAESQGK